LAKLLSEKDRVPVTFKKAIEHKNPEIGEVAFNPTTFFLLTL
jgi:hypothetical protein